MAPSSQAGGWAGRRAILAEGSCDLPTLPSRLSPGQRPLWGSVVTPGSQVALLL